jgi:hypothetical protein
MKQEFDGRVIMLACKQMMFILGGKNIKGPGQTMK